MMLREGVKTTANAVWPACYNTTFACGGERIINPRYKMRFNYEEPFDGFPFAAQIERTGWKMG